MTRNFIINVLKKKAVSLSRKGPTRIGTRTVEEHRSISRTMYNVVLLQHRWANAICLVFFFFVENQISNRV